MALIYENQVKRNKAAFIAKVVQIAAKLNVNPNWLMVVFMIECEMDERKTNRFTGGVGLLQFLPSTARNLGTTTARISKMSNVQQLDYVYKYLNGYKRKLISEVDIYLSVFFPAACGKSETYVLQTKNVSAKVMAKQNSSFDLNKDKQITKGELSQYLAIYKSKTNSTLPGYAT